MCCSNGQKIGHQPVKMSYRDRGVSTTGHRKGQEGRVEVNQNRQEQPPLTPLCCMYGDIAVTFDASFFVFLL